MKLLREPLLHFAVAGIVLFSIYSWLNRDGTDADSVEPVRIGQGEVDWLSKLYQNQWMRPPDTVELQGLVTDLVDEELLAREAEAMGLGKDDSIIRRRLAQKLKFVVEDTTRLAEPDEDALRSYFKANPERFETGSRVSFVQVYFNPASRKDAAADAVAALVGLANASPEQAEAAGDRFLLGPEMTQADRQAVSGVFGAEFADQLMVIEPGNWSGPLTSGYGAHLVLVREREAGGIPVFETVRDKVLAEWRREAEQKAAKDYLARLREKYGVELDDSVKALLEQNPETEVSMQ